MPTKLFDSLELTKGEEDFVHNVLKDGVALTYVQRAQTLATLRLAKEIENFSKASNKSSKSLNWLTFGLVFVGVVQIGVQLIQYFR